MGNAESNFETGATLGRSNSGFARATEAIGDGQLDELKDLIRLSLVDAAATNEDNASLLHVCAEYRASDALAYLLTCGAKLQLDSQTFSRKMTAVALAAEASGAGVVRLLIRHGADVNIRDKDGWTPLMHAVMTADVATVETLLAADNIDVHASVKGSGGSRPLAPSAHTHGAGGAITADSLARDMGYWKIAEKLEGTYSMASRRSGGAFQYNLATEAAGSGDGAGGMKSSANSSSGSKPIAAVDLDTQIKLAQDHADAGRLEAAVGVYTSIIDADKTPKSTTKLSQSQLADIHLGRAACLRSLRQAEAASADYSIALAILQADTRIVSALQGRAACSAGLDSDENPANVPKSGSAAAVSAFRSGSMPPLGSARSPAALREAILDLELALRLSKAQKQNNSAANQTDARGMQMRNVSAGGSDDEMRQLRSQLHQLELALEQVDSSYHRRIPGAEKNHYQVLKVPHDADDAAIRTAYRTLSRVYHPDRLGWAESGAGRRMLLKAQRLNAAYDILSDPTRRVFYDLELNAKELELQT